MIDRTTKSLLFAIALGLWLQLVTDWSRPTPAQAQGALTETYLKNMSSSLRAIEGTVDSIASGQCRNTRICAGILGR